MLTIFALPKPFQGHIGVIQRNAIRSWTLLRPACEIILIGDEEGTAEVAREFHVRHVPHIARNDYGTPLVNDLFDKGERLASHDTLCYVNSDIILMSDFMRAARQIVDRKRRFLMVGLRWNVDVTEPWDFTSDWEERLKDYIKKYGEAGDPSAIDYFLFTRGLWGDIPPFAIGRFKWDNWLLYRARFRGAPLIDAKDVVMAVHQNHGYSHALGGAKVITSSPEADRNLELAESHFSIFSIRDATHRLCSKGLQIVNLRRRLGTLPTLYRLRCRRRVRQILLEYLT